MTAPRRRPRRRVAAVLAAVLAAGPLLASAARASAPAGVSAFAWGADYYGQLGDGLLGNRPTPLPVHGLSQAVQVAEPI